MMTIEDYKSANHNLFDIYTGINSIILAESGFMEGIDIVCPINVTIDGVRVRKSGKGCKKTYPAWITFGCLPNSIR